MANIPAKMQQALRESQAHDTTKLASIPISNEKPFLPDSIDSPLLSYCINVSIDLVLVSAPECDKEKRVK